MEDSFLNGLNQHGYAFQHRVIHEALSPDPDGRGFTPWALLGTEVPVSGAERPTRIDFVLDRRQSFQSLRLLVAECKRVNPAFGTWCFTRSPYPRPEWIGEQVAVEFMKWEQEGPPHLRLKTGISRHRSERTYDISFELKSSRPGDAHPVSSDRDAIEAACTQVLRGLNGLMSALGRDEAYSSFVARQNLVSLVPVVFTTAKLVTADADLRETDIESGELRSLPSVRPIDWLYLQYAQTPQIRHSLLSGAAERDDFDDLVASSYVRSVVIVGPKGIRPFLQEASLSGW